MKYVLMGLLWSLSLPAVAQPIQSLTPEAGLPLDRIWVLVCTILVFLMQAGFLCLEAGMSRRKHMAVMAIKHLMDWCLISLTFYLVGFGLMFGPSLAGLFGTGLFAFGALSPTGDVQALGGTFFLFMLAFAGTATAMVSGAMAERTSFIAYMATAAMVSLVIYPVYGHWVWGNLFLSGNRAWLAELGFHDFAGSSVVHVLGGTVALVGIWQVGPRLGRFRPDGQTQPFEAVSVPLACLGAFLLWLGWWGFNGGSLYSFQAMRVADIILNTNLCGAAGAISAFFHCICFQQGRELPFKFLGGALGGLVASTAVANLTGPQGVLLLGLLVGPVHNLAWVGLRRLKLDDPVGVVPAHAVCGALGILSVPLIGQAELLPAGSRLAQLGVQLLGLGVCILWTGGMAWLLFRLLRIGAGLRVSPVDEMNGLTFSLEPGAEPPADDVALRSFLGMAEPSEDT
ncbi:MAG: ammonium transporter [Candidatus Melainabacteria bacterium HGW-Melainabacteria-1]|nr:MAG: ammonium transporter [Candidatus Melainabacteria bacterium HGW-Melainabacteria-1]